MDFLIVVEDVITGEEVRAEFLALRLWRYSGQPCNNRQTYGELDVTVGFSRLERSRNTLEGCLIVLEGCFTAERDGSSLSRSRCPWLLSFYTCSANCSVSYLLSSTVSYCHSLPGLCVRKCRNRGVCGSNSTRTLQSIDEGRCLPGQ